LGKFVARDDAVAPRFNQLLSLINVDALKRRLRTFFMPVHFSNSLFFCPLIRKKFRLLPPFNEIPSSVVSRFFPLEVSFTRFLPPGIPLPLIYSSKSLCLFPPKKCWLKTFRREGTLSLVSLSFGTVRRCGYATPLPVVPHRQGSSPRPPRRYPLRLIPGPSTAFPLLTSAAFRQTLPHFCDVRVPSLSFWLLPFPLVAL